MKVCNLGSLNVDYVYSVEHFVQQGETILTDMLQVNSGGKGLNQSIALACAGMEVWHAGIIGQGGEFLKETLQRGGVNTQLLTTSPSRCGHAIIQVTPHGQNSIIVYQGTNGELKPEYLQTVLAQLAPQDVLLLQGETNLIAESIRAAHEKGIRVAWNASPVGSAWPNDLLDCVRWLFINEIEGEALTDQRDPHAILSALRAAHPALEIILTLGEKGSVHAGPDCCVFCPACHVPVQDTTAAGDTFTGYFLRAVLQPVAGYTPLQLATTASAIAVTRQGAAPSIPTLAEVTAFEPEEPLQETAWTV